MKLLFERSRPGRRECLIPACDVPAAHVQAHALEALYVEIGVVGGIVGEEEEVPPRFLHAADEVQRTGNEVFAEVEGAVHIEKEAAHVLYVHFPPSSKAILPQERLCTAASASTR